MIYGISYKSLIGPKPLCIRFDIVDGFTRVYGRTRYLTLLDSQKYDAIYKRSRCLIGLKSSIIHFSLLRKNDSYDTLPIEKRLTLHNVTILIKSVLNKDQNHCYYKIFLEKCSYQLAKKSQFFF